MMDTPLNYNKRLICVDDEEGMLDTYSQVLGAQPDVFAEILDESRDADRNPAADCRPGGLKFFDIITAQSGEEAHAPITGRHLPAPRVLHQEPHPLPSGCRDAFGNAQFPCRSL